MALDFRSDTVTRPTTGMLAAMQSAPLGDDVFDEDPTVHALQTRVAKLLGKEAALFVPSGTMSNQIAVRVHTSPGDEVLCEDNCHIYVYEQAGYAQLSGVAVRPLPGKYGVLEPEQFTGMVRPDDQHFARTRLVCLENTHNRGAGRIQPYDKVAAICDWAHQHGLVTHMDGARLMNAVMATGISAADWAQHFDTVSVCFSKGLGAPIGSALVGPSDVIAKARRIRKVFGGGMRQAGIIAAAALYALDNHIERLAEDHRHALQLADGVAGIDGLTLSPAEVETNILCFDVDLRLGTAGEFVWRLKERGLLVLAIGPTRVRIVTHLDVDGADVEQALEILREVTAEAARGKGQVPVGQTYG
jgi:threonine aldolase